MDEITPAPPEEAFEELQARESSKGPAGSVHPGAWRLDQAAERNDNLLAWELSDADARASLHAEQPVGSSDVPPFPMDRAERLQQARMTEEGAPPPSSG
ncbi:MAG: hypothetical protein ACYCW6_12660 [Candidatus Xenobia bacterium]